MAARRNRSRAGKPARWTDAVRGTLISTTAAVTAFGPLHSLSLPLLQGASLLGLPLPAYAALPLLGLTGLWVGDQLNAPWRRRRQPRYPEFPVKISLKGP